MYKFNENLKLNNTTYNLPYRVEDYFLRQCFLKCIIYTEKCTGHKSIVQHIFTTCLCLYNCDQTSQHKGSHMAR